MSNSNNRSESRGGSSGYDGFISYSHAADDLLAPRLQAGLQRFAKPWWKRRALRIFRDESSLSANPHLWSSIVEALDNSAWFVLLLSPDAAQSEWVNQEIEYWKTHKDPSRILPVLTDGTFEWTSGDVTGTAVPEQLRGTFSEEPRWVDMRFARDETDLDLKNPRFADTIADIASALRGVPKDELASEEVKQHRRTIRTAWASGVTLLLFAVAAVGFGIQAASERDNAQRLAQSEADARTQAEEQRGLAESATLTAQAEALAAAAISQIEIDPERSVLLALQSLRSVETSTGLEAMHKALQAHRTLWQMPLAETANDEGIFIHPDGTHVLVAHDAIAELTYWDLEAPGEPLWRVSLAEIPILTWAAWFDVSTNEVTLSVSDLWAASDAAAPTARGFFTLDLRDGELVELDDEESCLMYVRMSRPTRGAPTMLLLSDPVRADDPDRCDRFNLAGSTWTVVHPSGKEVVLDLPGELFWDRWPSFTAAGEHMSIGMDGESYVLDTTTGEIQATFDGRRPILSPDGSHLLLLQDGYVELIERESGALLRTFPGIYSEIAFGQSGNTMIGLSQAQGVEVFDLTTGERQYELVGPATRAWWLDQAPAADRIAVGSAEDLRVWDLSRFRTEVESSPSRVDVNAVSGIFQVRAGVRRADGLVHVPGEVEGDFGYVVYDEADGSVVRSMVGTWPVSRLSPDGRILEVSLLQIDDESEKDLYGRPRLVDARTGEGEETLPNTCSFWHLRERFEFEPGPDCSGELRYLPLRDVEFSADGSVVALGSHTHESLVFDLATGEQWSADVTVLPDEGSSLQQVALSDDGSLFAYFLPIRREDEDFNVYETEIIDLASGAGLGRVEMCNPSSEMLFSEDNTQLFVSDWCADIAVYDLATLEKTATYGRAQGGSLTDLDVSGDRYASVGEDGTVRVWESSVVVLEVPLDALTMNVEFLDHDHVQVITAAGDVVTFTLNTEQLLQVAQGRLTRGFSDEECRQYALNPCPNLDDLREG